uniref:Uncharacterized protein n=1 Tax=Pipistrellus kuhlii TaxID=59472 RepID=A0A7J8B1C6_PIPKU|nr:hypothetical protein mPipKuh1_007786 [Pipistrellus kuhlii]
MRLGKGPFLPVGNPGVCDSPFFPPFSSAQALDPSVLYKHLVNRTLAPPFVHSVPILYFNGLFKPKCPSKPIRKKWQVTQTPEQTIHITGTSNPTHKANAVEITTSESESQGESQDAKPPESSCPETYKTL